MIAPDLFGTVKAASQEICNLSATTGAFNPQVANEEI